MNKKEVIGFINNGLKSGFPKEEIISQMQKSGWSKKEILSLLSQIDNVAEKKEKLTLPTFKEAKSKLSNQDIEVESQDLDYSK